MPVDPAGEQGHALVLDLRAVEGGDLEAEEIAGGDQLRQGHPAVVGGVGGRVLGAVAVVHLHPARVLDAVDLGGGVGEDDSLGEGRGGVEEHLVVGLGQDDDGVPLQVRLGVAPAPVGAADGPDRLAQFGHGEQVPQPGQHLRGEPVAVAHFAQLPLEQGLVVEGVLQHPGGGDEGRDRVQPDLPVRADDPGTEGDGGQVPFADGAQAEDEAPGAGRDPGLVRVPDHGRVEQGRRFHRVLLGEVGADEQPARLRERVVDEQVAPQVLEPAQERLLQLVVPALEQLPHLGQAVGRLGVGEGKHPGQDPGGPGLVEGAEGPGHHPGRVRLEDRSDPFDLHHRTAPSSAFPRRSSR